MKYIIFGIYYFFIMIITDKIVIKIDEKERKRIAKYETEYLKEQYKIFYNKAFKNAVKREDING